MQDSHRLTALHAALRFLVTSDIPSQHKSVLIDVLMQRLRDDEAAELRQRQCVQLQGGWREHEILQLRSFLQGRVARSWQHADERVMQLAAQLRRHPRVIREKAVELGLAAAVDYRFAKMLRHDDDDS